MRRILAIVIMALATAFAVSAQPLKFPTVIGSGRDGMPVVMLLDGMIYMAVETSEPGTRLHPVVVCSTLEDNLRCRNITAKYILCEER